MVVEKLQQIYFQYPYPYRCSKIRKIERALMSDMMPIYKTKPRSVLIRALFREVYIIPSSAKE